MSEQSGPGRQEHPLSSVGRVIGTEDSTHRCSASPLPRIPIFSSTTWWSLSGPFPVSDR